MQAARRFFGVMMAMLLALALMAPEARADESVDLGIITVATKQQAEKVRQILEKGAAFEETARKYSQGPAVSRGGRVGRQDFKRLRVEYRQALDDLPPDKPSKVVPVEDGYAVLMRFDKPRKEEQPKRSLALESPGHYQPKSAAAPGLSAKDIQEVPGYLEARRLIMAGLESMVIGDFKQAEEFLSQAMGNNPHDESGAFLLGVDRQAIKGEVKAKAATSFADGFMALNDGDAEKARDLFAKAVQEDPRLWQAALFEANMEAGLGDTAKARKILNDLLAQKPDVAEAHLSLAIMDVYAMKPKDAKPHLEKALELKPTMSQALYQMGQISVMEGDAKKAEGYFRSAIAADPYFEEAYNDLGLIYMHLGRLNEAQKSFEKSLEVNPSFALAHLSLGNLYASQKQFNRAIDEYNKALEVDPGLAPANFNAALAYINLGQWAQAQDHARQAARMGMSIPPAMAEDLKLHNPEQ